MNTYLWIHLAAGFLIIELIVQLYAVYFATPEEKQLARKISHENLNSIPDFIPFSHILVPDAFATGPWSIAPIITVSGFIFVWYLLIPTILISFVAPTEVREVWFLAMRIIGSGGY